MDTLLLALLRELNNADDSAIIAMLSVTENGTYYKTIALARLCERLN